MFARKLIAETIRDTVSAIPHQMQSLGQKPFFMFSFKYLLLSIDFTQMFDASSVPKSTHFYVFSAS